jgi:hypothetical protein
LQQAEKKTRVVSQYLTLEPKESKINKIMYMNRNTNLEPNSKSDPRNHTSERVGDGAGATCPVAEELRHRVSIQRSLPAVAADGSSRSSPAGDSILTQEGRIRAEHSVEYALGWRPKLSSCQLLAGDPGLKNEHLAVAGM